MGLVREGGLEPPHPCGYWHLKPARLPFRHSRLVNTEDYQSFKAPVRGRIDLAIPGNLTEGGASGLSRQGRRENRICCELAIRKVLQSATATG